MENTITTSRLCQLILQDYNGYLNAERPEAIATLRAHLVTELDFSEQMLPQLEEEYRKLIKGDDTVRRMEVGARKLQLAAAVEDIRRKLSNEESLRILARRHYSQTKELQDSLAEQRQIINSIWGKQ